MQSKESGLTIGRLARAANVGIETVRYYQRRDLLPTPDPTTTAFRIYPAALVDRIRFIKRAQDLGFSLDEIAIFLRLEDGGNREVIRQVAKEHLANIRTKLADLRRMESALESMVEECEATGCASPCPIISAIAAKN
jgi:MerR family mercuric resistance operon transcriptional regulator